MAPEQRAMAVIVRASPVAISRATRRMGWLAAPWCFGVIFGDVALFDRLGRPQSDTPLALRLALIVVAAIPVVMYVTSPWLGRVPAMRWLLAWPQPEARLDRDGLTLILPDREPIRFDWSAITGMQPANDFRRSTHLLGTSGEVLATLPDVLAYPRGRGLFSRSLAQVVVDVRPDRYELTGTNAAGVADRFALRDPDHPVASDVDPMRRQAIVVGVLLALLGGFGIVAAVVWFAIGAPAG